MQSEELLALTASEPLSMEEEMDMQRKSVCKVDGKLMIR